MVASWLNVNFFNKFIALTILNTLLTTCFIAGIKGGYEYVGVSLMVSFVNKVCLGAVLGFVVISSAVNAAQAASCRAMALDAADEWANGQIAPATDNQPPLPDYVVVISYGVKYLVPRHMQHDENGKLPMLGELAREYNQVQGEEQIRCLTSHGYSFYIYPN